MHSFYYCWFLCHQRHRLTVSMSTRVSRLVWCHKYLFWTGKSPAILSFCLIIIYSLFRFYYHGFCRWLFLSREQKSTMLSGDWLWCFQELWRLQGWVHFVWEVMPTLVSPIYTRWFMYRKTGNGTVFSPNYRNGWHTPAFMVIDTSVTSQYRVIRQIWMHCQVTSSIQL